MKIIVYYSGGMDSTASLIWAVRTFINSDVIALHSKLDVALPVFDYIEDITSKLGVKLVVIEPEKSLFDSFKKREIPWFSNPWCRKEFINKPLNEYIKKTYKIEDTILIFGGHKKEKIDKLLNSDGTFRKPNRTSYQRFSGIEKYQTIQPFFYLPKKEIEHFILNEGFDIWEGYKKGFVRTSCWICPFQSKKQSIALYKNNKELFEELERFENMKGGCIKDGQPNCNKDDNIGICSWVRKWIESDYDYGDLLKYESKGE